jgi:uncharacterized protein (TIGR03086 family)
MTDLLALFNQGLAEFGVRVHRVGPDQWTGSTPCSEWNTNALVDHLIDEQLWVPPLMSGHDLGTAEAIVKSEKRTLGGDRVAAWDAAALGSKRAFGDTGALDRDVALSRGPTPATDYLNEMLFDAIVHSWDLGRAVGYPEPLANELVQYALSGVQSFGDLSATGLFAQPVAVSGDASAEDRLVALTGRNPR